jgi:hypothetical protein
LRTAIPHTRSTDTVFSLSVNAYVGADLNLLSVRSSAITTLGIVLSHNGNTTRKRDHANHAQNKIVCRPATAGPSP